MKDEAYNYIHSLRSQFVPRTPGAALQAAEEEILPIEAFTYKSTALNPLLKKPYNTDEIDWLLSRKDRDLNTNLILKTVLDELARGEDKEIALFAAESLTAIEKEYNSRLEVLKEAIEKDNSPEDRTLAAEIYYHLAMLNKNEGTLSNFYMKEAYLLLKDEENRTDNSFLFKILMALKLYDQAESLLFHSRKCLICHLEVAFKKNDMARFMEILKELAAADDLNEEEQKVVDFWMGTP